MSITLHPSFLTEPKDNRYLLAISGGRDSVALMHLLLDNDIKNIILCHLNHGLRNEESDQDANFVQKLAEQYQLTCEITFTDIHARINETGESLELAARNARHEYFATCAKKHTCHKILFGHHADDQAETILFKLLRGSSGLKGIDYQSFHQLGDEKLEFIRPLLSVSRADINHYIESHGIAYREDSSNSEAIAVRNRIRNEALPLLCDIMGRDIKPAINRAATISTSREQALRETLSEHQVEDPQGRLYLPTLKELPKALQQIIIHDYLKKHHVSNISHDLLEQCLGIIHDESTAKINLPNDRFFRRKEQRAFIQ